MAQNPGGSRPSCALFSYSLVRRHVQTMSQSEVELTHDHNWCYNRVFREEEEEEEGKKAAE